MPRSCGFSFTAAFIKAKFPLSAVTRQVFFPNCSNVSHNHRSIISSPGTIFPWTNFLQADTRNVGVIRRFTSRSSSVGGDGSEASTQARWRRRDETTLMKLARSSWCSQPPVEVSNSSASINTD
ncbi:hypothetical protein M758_1G223600 [Ceratodon purpureus]|nr:hypothetical protein M758_1G223600 [Ceratodon purpureus]